MKGDAGVVDYLNKALRSELTAISQYWLHYRLQDNWGYGKLAEKSRKESIEEMHHADKLMDRIIFLEGHPNLQRILLNDDWSGHPLRKDYEFPLEYHGIRCR